MEDTTRPHLKEIAMSRINTVLTYALSLLLIVSGIAKFAGGHVFAYIEHRSGIDLFDPVIGYATGVVEIVAGLLILVPRTRFVGAATAATVMVGAIGFHLSPWLGVSMPTGLADGAAAPWTAADFTTETTSFTFALAIITLVRSIVIMRTELRARRTVDGTAVVLSTAHETAAA
ncbi:MAG: DoxX family protein [Actinomycetota bacterium]